MKIAIIGAGAAGLAAAWDLVKVGHEVTVFESESTVGGLAAGFKDDHWEWSLEKFYHHWFETDKTILVLAEELGLRDKVLFPRPKTSYLLDGKIYRSEISPSALFLPLSMIAKIRMGLTGVFLKLTRSWQHLEQHSAHDWLMRTMGKEAYQRLWMPLLIGKFSTRYREVNMAWLWARIFTRSLRLGIFEGGFQAFMEAFASAVTAHGAQILLNTPVQKIAVVNGSPALTINGEQHVFDRVISTLSPGLMLKLTDGLAETLYGTQIKQLESIGAICVVVALKHSLLTDGTYWLNLPAASADKKENPYPFLALVEHTNWMDRQHYNGDHLLYCGDYVPVDHEYFSMTDEILANRFIDSLNAFNPAFSREWVRKFWVFRAPYAQPVPLKNHSQNIPSLQTPLSGIYWASMSQVYPWDRGTNYAIELGQQVAKLAQQ